MSSVEVVEVLILRNYTDQEFYDSRGSVVNIPAYIWQGVGSNLAQIAKDFSLTGSDMLY